MMGAEYVAVTSLFQGNLKSAEASREVRARESMQLQRSCASMNRLTLFLASICHVKRALTFCHNVSRDPRTLVSGANANELRSPAFRLATELAM